MDATDKFPATFRRASLYDSDGHFITHEFMRRDLRFKTRPEATQDASEEWPIFKNISTGERVAEWRRLCTLSTAEEAIDLLESIP